MIVIKYGDCDANPCFISMNKYGKHFCCVLERSNRSTTSSPLGGREALICQIQTGIQLRKSTNGAKIRQTSPTGGYEAL